MSVPLDRLYNHLDGLCNHDILIYRFYPHGSKNLADLLPLYNFKQHGWRHQIEKPGALCHDQEPLFFDQYTHDIMLDYFVKHTPSIANNPDNIARIKKLVTDQNLRSIIGTRHSVYDKTLLVHSEQNSHNLAQYENADFVGVYWWAHAAIAADWYRYAPHDLGLVPNFNQIKKDFLVYNRAWSGTREYRLKFTELLVENNLQQHCQMTFNPHCESGHYTAFQPKNSNFKVQSKDLENYFEPCKVDATASADYTTLDYNNTAIEVVLETLFDDARWHLTEKSLRPIACGRPFILAATAGSLQYLRNYGFKTFDGMIDESYDTIKDPAKRLASICAEMKRISQLPLEQKHQLWHDLYEIADYNKKLFFSNRWQESIFDEFMNNLNRGLSIVEQYKTGRHWLEFRNAWTQNPDKFKLADAILLESMQHQTEVEQLIR